MKPKIHLLVSVAIIAATLILPALSLTAANIAAETGALTRVGGHPAIELPWANSMGLGPWNILFIVGLLIIANTLISTAYRLRSPQG